MKSIRVRRVILKIAEQTKGLLPFPGFFANRNWMASGSHWVELEEVFHPGPSGKSGRASMNLLWERGPVFPMRPLHLTLGRFYHNFFTSPMLLPWFPPQRVVPQIYLTLALLSEMWTTFHFPEHRYCVPRGYVEANGPTPSMAISTNAGSYRITPPCPQRCYANPTGFVKVILSHSLYGLEQFPEFLLNWHRAETDTHAGALKSHKASPGTHGPLLLRTAACMHIYNSVFKKEEILPFMTTWMNQEDITLSEISQAQKDKCIMIPLTCGI